MREKQIVELKVILARQGLRVEVPLRMVRVGVEYYPDLRQRVDPDKGIAKESDTCSCNAVVVKVNQRDFCGAKCELNLDDVTAFRKIRARAYFGSGDGGKLDVIGVRMYKRKSRELRTSL